MDLQNALKKGDCVGFKNGTDYLSTIVVNFMIQRLFEVFLPKMVMQVFLLQCETRVVRKYLMQLYHIGDNL